MLRLAVALGYLMTCAAQIRFFLEDTDMRLTVQHLIGKDNGVYPCHACNRGGSYDSGLPTETSQARSSTELGTSESSRLESTMKQSTTETGWPSSTETSEQSSTQTTISDSTEFSTTSIEPRTTETGSTETIVSGTTGATESGSTETESASTEKSWRCKSAYFGCCPENVTIAHGPNNEGCGCQYTQFGCCPDRRTESQGPNFGGCACHTYQFGCCADGVTAATGPNFQGCVCQYSEYGCCGDEATAAKGPNKEGCDCSNSKFGCCPDGVTEAKGEKFLNCPDVPENKQDLPYTPRPSEQKESEGRAEEGGKATLRCFLHGNPPPKIIWRKGEITIEGGFGRYRLLSDGALEIASLYRNDTGVYICVADNGLGVATQEIRLEVLGTSESSRLESTTKKSTTQTIWSSSTETTELSSTQATSSDSTKFSSTSIEPGSTGTTESGSSDTELCSTETSCGCKSAHFGCCPDNVTIAHGPNNKGCGCQYTQFGCCPDRRTESQGPNFGGCACHTYQFGCCADGVSAATGPNFQGCVCQYSKYGCCGDEATAAKGTNKEGCDCSNSKFGCCPDGVIEAKGEKFLNCSDVPENKQDLPYAPRRSEQREPEVRAREGGKVTLRCFLHGNPPPKIIWRHGEITIEGDFGRYRLLSDGALEIVSLYRNDTGVYICVADNGLGVATQEIRLEVLDPVEGPAGISGTPNAVVVGEMGRSLSIRCLAYGYPQPAIYWYRGDDGPMVPYSSSLYETKGDVLQIRKLMPETLGEYICQAYNGYGKPADWAIVVQAYRPEGSEEYPYMVTRQTQRSVTPYEFEPQTEPTTAGTTEIDIPFSVPVRTRITTDSTRLPAGSEINLPCDVDGFPVPEVYWTKDGVQIQRQPTDDRIYVTEARLTIARANTNDSGVYGCHANNGYTSDYSTVQISVEGLYIPASCKDSPYFVNCNLIVKSKFCHHKYYSKFCCKTCLEAGQLDPNELELMQADMAWRRK